MRRIEFAGFDGAGLAIDTVRGEIAGAWTPIEGARRWRLDFDLPAELCRCCGQELLPSGTRWSVWFCEPCKKRVVRLNHRARRCAIPIGRHSLMNDVFDLPGRAADRVEIDGLVVGLRELFAKMDRLDDWTHEIVRRNCAALGFGDRARVALGEYLVAVRKARISRADAFHEMLAWSGEEKPRRATPGRQRRTGAS